MIAALAILVAYIIGAIPTGYLVGKIGYGLDIRQFGSGNLGATNVQRVLGARAGLLVLMIDALKGALAISGSVYIINRSVSFPIKPGAASAAFIVVIALAVIAGNMFSIFMKGRGGKGIGVATGILFMMMPQIAAILFTVWLIVTVVTKYVSLASLSIAALFPILVWWFHGSNKPYMIFAFAASALVFYSHRSNIKRLITRSELRVDQGMGKDK